MSTGQKLRHWSVPHFALGGVIIAAVLAFGLAAQGQLDQIAGGSPMAIVAGGAFWGAVVAWAHNRLARPPKG